MVLQYISVKHILKIIGFTVSVKKRIKQTSVLQYRSPANLKKHWFYNIGQNKCQRNIGFTDLATEIVAKANGFTEQPYPATAEQPPSNGSGGWNSHTRLDEL